MKKHKKPLAPGWARLTAVLLALVTLWLVPAAAFGAEGPVTVQLEAPQLQDSGIANWAAAARTRRSLPSAAGDPPTGAVNFYSTGKPKKNQLARWGAPS